MQEVPKTTLRPLHTSIRNLEASLDPGDRLSLGQHIVTRTRNAYLTSSDKESRLLLAFVREQYFMQREGNIDLSRENLGAMAVDEFPNRHRELQNAFRHSWERLQEYYLKRANVVLCAASTAAGSLPGKCSESIVLLEEASQMSEVVCLLAVVPHFCSTKKIIFPRDCTQLPPTVMALSTSEGCHGLRS